MALWQVLCIYGVPQKYINIYKTLHDGTQCCIKTNYGTTDFFRIKAGVQ